MGIENLKVSEKFLSMGIQQWGQTHAQVVAATEAYLTVAGFDLEKQKREAERWLNDVTANLKRGKYEDEVSQLEAALVERQTEKAK